MNEKDVSTKVFFKDNRRFADIMNAGLFHGKKIVQDRYLEDNIEAGGALKGKSRKKKAVYNVRDLVKKSMFGTNLVLLGIENQSELHYAMPVRIMGYDYLSYEEQLREIARIHEREKDLTGAEYLSRFSKEDRIHMTFTLILYYGEKPWDGPTKLSDMIDWTDIPEELRKLAADYPIYVLDVRRFNGVENLETDVRLVFGFLQRQDNPEQLRKYIQANQAGFSDMQEDAYDMLSTLSKSKELDNVMKEKEEEGGIDMCEALRQWRKEAIEEGISQGMTDGMIKGAAQSVIELLEMKGSVPEEIKEKIFAQRDRALLSQWHKNAAVSENLEAFLETIS